MHKSTFTHSRTRRATTADRIKQLILSSKLSTGDPLPTETELCRMLSVSRSSVREAIRVLATLDIVQVRHGYGTYVGEMSLNPLVQTLVFRGVISPERSLGSLKEVIEIRMALDLSLAERIVSSAADMDPKYLRSLVEEMVQKASRRELFAEADRAFHSCLVQMSKNGLAEQLVDAFWEVHTAVMPQLGIAQPEDIIKTARAHGDMLEAVLSGDVDAYRKAVVEHYEPLRKALEC